MSLVNPCSLSVLPSNTGAECNGALKATAMIIMVPKAATWHESDLADFTSFIETKIHAPAETRWFPIFGNTAPVRAINESNENDVIETLEDGSVQFIRYGMYNRTFQTTEGGLALARHLMAMRNNYSFIEVDIINQVAMMKNADGSFSGFPVNLAYAPAPMIANLKTSYKNQFMLSFKPADYVRKGIIWASDADEDILGTRGLFDVEVLKGTASGNTQSVTHVFVKVQTIDGDSDLIALFNTTLAHVGNFVVRSASGTIITPTACAITNGEIDLTGTYTTGTNITVTLAAPSVLKAAGIEGYEATQIATIAIP